MLIMFLFFCILVEKSSKYYLLRNLMLGLFEIIDSDRIPQKVNRKSDALSQTSNTSIHHFQNTHSVYSASGSSSSHSLTSSTHFPTNKEWFKRLASYTSMSPSSLGSSSNHMEVTNEMVELISRCLLKCSEEAGYIPLFKDIFTTLNEINENRYTRLLDGRARDILLMGVITRMTQHASKHVGLVFICDDVQCKIMLIQRRETRNITKCICPKKKIGADNSSIRILQHIHEHCQKVMILMATRPLKDYNVGFIDTFRSTGSHQYIELNGLGEREIGEIILQNFDSGVHRVSPEIVKVVQVRQHILCCRT